MATLTDLLRGRKAIREAKLYLDPTIAPKVPAGAPRPFAPGEYMTNPDGSWSSERSMTVLDHPGMNNGKPTIIPSLWLVNGKPVVAKSTDEAVQYAQQSGLSFKAFQSLQEAEKFATDRESAWQKHTPQTARGVAPLYSQMLQNSPLMGGR